jgi:hypothetical protein
MLFHPCKIEKAAALLMLGIIATAFPVCAQSHFAIVGQAAAR